jgi:hypothetical protein
MKDGIEKEAQKLGVTVDISAAPSESRPASASEALASLVAEEEFPRLWLVGSSSSRSVTG